MGEGRWTPEAWEGYTTVNNHATKSTHEIYAARNIHPDLNPLNVKFRESRDSVLNPLSNAIIVSLDVTGSMQSVLDSMARKGLNQLLTKIYDFKPVTDPHVMCMGIGDVEAGDEAPLQVTQFEADIRLAEQLENIWLEGGGGGNQFESYSLAWYFAAHHTSIDCFEKRGKKGYLFTIGDEEPTPRLRRQDIKSVFGDDIEADINMQDLLTLVTRKYEVFHLMVEEGSHYRHSPDKTRNAWTEILGQRALRLSDHKMLSEVIVSAIRVNEGEAADAVTKSWDKSTSLVVSKAIDGLSRIPTSGGDNSVVTL
jgi:hypothetical protein